MKKTLDQALNDLRARWKELGEVILHEALQDCARIKRWFRGMGA